jgi:hypothetical protein
MTTPLIPKRANAELVALAYLRAMVAAYDTGVGAILQGPNPETGRITWSRGGFIQASGITGAIDAYVPVRHTVVSIDVYAAPSGQSKKPPWGLAFSLAELIIASTFDTALHDTHSVVTLPTGFPSVRVTGFQALTEPSRRVSDPADYAHVGFDVQLSWHGLSDTWSADQEP